MRRLFLFCLLSTAFIAHAADWPPALDAANKTMRATNGRIIERYTHGPREAWGYPQGIDKEWVYTPGEETGANGQNHNSFYLVSPKTPREGAPLCVVLHSANRTAYDYLGYGHLDRKIGGGDDPATVATRSPDDFYALYLSTTNSEWYGWKERHNHPELGTKLTAAEKRVLDTIEWVIAQRHCDRNRVYLCGVSMGGCGTLALGLPHGDIFAAVRAQVPAGTEYAATRMGGFLPEPAANAPAAERDAWLRSISASDLPDPPVLVDFSAQNDNWSKTQPALVQAAQAGRLPLVLSWGLFGHTTFTSVAAKFPLCDVALAFPWQEIRRNEAYPVFTHASCNQRCPWLDSPQDFDASGQLNAWFRWKVESDTQGHFGMQLWLVHPQVDHPPASMPESATVDVTLRRLQHFKVLPGNTAVWRIKGPGDKELAAGWPAPDATGLITVPHVTLTTGPLKLELETPYK